MGSIERLMFQPPFVGGCFSYALVTDAAGHTTTYTYNALGKVATITDAMGNAQEYTYDAMARNTAVKDAH